MGHNVVVLFHSQLSAFGFVDSGSHALFFSYSSFCLNIWISVEDGRATKKKSRAEAGAIHESNKR